jgi:iron complex outermembrane receptor protein
MKRIFGAITLLGIALLGFGQETRISGMLLDDETGMGVYGAQVIVLTESDSALAITQMDGSFEIALLVKGAIKINISHITYEKQSLLLNASQASEDLRIYLKPKQFIVKEAEIRGLRADRFTPSTFTDLDQKEISEMNFGRDIPFVLALTPSTVSHSDAGAGIGYSGVRIRGVDATRTNVTINGIPYNDAESQGVFWVNLPDMASSATGIQVQRGVGTSTNGAAAFGAGIHIQTDDHREEAFGQITTAIGSFNTQRASVRFGTGRTANNWSFTGRLSSITSDGFIDRATSDLKSFYFSLAKYGEKSSFTANVFSGKERTYQAWWGIPEPKFKGDEDGVERYINQLWLSDEEAQNLRESNPSTYNYYTYENEVDNYGQDHYQLFYNLQINKHLGLNTAAHYTYGRGYFEQYRSNGDLSEVGVDTVFVGGDTITQADHVRRLWLDNHFYGLIANLLYRKDNWSITWGNSANQYRGDHFGELVWSRFAGNSETGDRFYENDALKSEISSFLKLGYSKNEWNYYADFQLRAVNYQFQGPNRFGVILPQDLNFVFFNPKAGVSWIKGGRKAYASFAVSHREPVRDDLVNAGPESRPGAERLYNTEMGWRKEGNQLTYGVNVYGMFYEDQLVLTGEVNDVGAFTRVNVDRSFRAGVETELHWKLNEQWAVGGNLSLSRNRIIDFTEFVDDWDVGGQREISHGNTNLAFSPEVVSMQQLRYTPVKRIDISLINKYVSRQYLDNSGSVDRSLEAFMVQDLQANWHIPSKALKDASLGLQVNNISNRAYAPNGYTFSGIIDGQRQSFNYLYPMAGINYLLRLNLLF